MSKSHKKHDHQGEKCAIIDSVSELDCRARGSPLPRLEWLVRERPVLSSYLVDTIMANRDFVEKRVMVRGASKMHEVSNTYRHIMNKVCDGELGQVLI